MNSLRVSTTIQPRGPAGALVLTDDQVATLGGGKRAAVRVRIGDHEASLRLAVMGGENLIGVSKANRAALHVEVGDRVDALITLDAEPRESPIPDDLLAALAADPEATTFFETLPPSARKAFATWVDAAKRPETRRHRLDESLAKLRAGERL